MAGAKWSDAISRLEQLRALNPNYRAAETGDLLYQSFVAAGNEAKAAGQIELARERFDGALALKNGDAQIQRERDLAELYLDGQQAVDFNWKVAIEKFTELHAMDPSYNNVKQRLMDAHTSYGDLAMRQNASCLAVKSYDSALALGRDARLTEKRANAMATCRAAVVVTPTPSLPGAGDNYMARISTGTTKACNTGVGDVSGVVRDALGQPLSGVTVAYYADGINRIITRTDAGGNYSFVWGAEAGVFHLIILAVDGKTPVGTPADVHYPGASKPGCHIIVDWQKL
jgi:tetratricopeptide (TPR) repeat protein